MRSRSRASGKSMLERFSKITIALALAALSLISCGAAFAYVSDAALSSKLTAAKVLPKGVAHRIVRSEGNNIRIDVTHYPTLDQRTQKVDALLLARTLLHADPGGISSVVTRIYHDSEPGTYHDILVSNRDIVGADAGIMGTDELLSGIGLVTIRVNDSIEQRCSKYCQAAENALRKEDFRESENLFQQAYRESSDAVRLDPKYFSGMVQLAHGYSGREDADDEARVFKAIVAALPPTTTAGEALQAVRDTYYHYFSKKDFSNAERAARALVDVQSRSAAAAPEDYASDLILLAACHRKLGQVEQAKKEYEEALLLKRNQLGENHPGLAEIFEGLGDCYNDEKNVNTADQFWKQAKVAYDHAVVTKDTKHRISYEVYRSIIARLNQKLAKPVKHW